MREQKMRLSALLLATVLPFLAVPPASAQSLSGVSGAVVRPGDTSIEYRVGGALEDDGLAARVGHRLHFQHAFDDRWRARILVVQSKLGADTLKTRSVGFEVLRQFVESEDSGGWDSAVRIDGTVPVAGGPGRARIGWLNGYQTGPWEFRGVVFVDRGFGDKRAPGVSIETRSEATRALHGVRLGVQMFNFYGSTAGFGGFDDQRHQLGPVLKGRIGERVRYEASALFGVSRAASDADFRLFLSYGF